MNVLMLSRLLGWFSLAIGATEIAAPATLSNALGLPGGRWLVRAFGAREVIAGFAVLAKPDSALGPVARVAGDALDLAVLVPALARSNDKRGAAHMAFVMVVGITALDLFCAASLASGNRRRARTARRTRAAPGHSIPSVQETSA